MTDRRLGRNMAALTVTLSLALTSCGTRLDHDTIAAGALDGGTVGGVTGAAPGTGTERDTGAAPGTGTGAGTATGSTDPSAAGSNGASSGAGGVAPGSGARQGEVKANPPTGKGGTGDKNRGGGPIVIGSVGWYSGPVGVSFAQIPRALQAWAAHTNANGGINGRPVKVIVYDDGGDTAKSRSYVRELVEQHNAVALVANAPFTVALRGWTGYLEDKKVPAIGGSCGKGWNDSPILFSQCPSIDSWVYGTALLGAKYARGKKLGGLFCTEGELCADVENRLFDKGFAERAGLDPRYRARISITQPDFTSECIQARNAGVDVMLVIGDPNSIARVASSCRRQNFTPQFLQPSVSVNAATVSKPGLGDVLTPAVTFPFAGQSSAASQEFKQAWRKFGGGQEPGPGASLGWAAAKIFEKAARGSGNQITRQTLLDQLYSFKNERFGGVTVPLSYGKEGTADSKCMFFMQGQTAKWIAPATDDPHCW